MHAIIAIVVALCTLFVAMQPVKAANPMQGTIEYFEASASRCRNQACRDAIAEAQAKAEALGAAALELGSPETVNDEDVLKEAHQAFDEASRAYSAARNRLIRYGM